MVTEKVKNALHEAARWQRIDLKRAAALRTTFAKNSSMSRPGPLQALDYPLLLPALTFHRLKAARESSDLLDQDFHRLDASAEIPDKTLDWLLTFLQKGCGNLERR